MTGSGAKMERAKSDNAVLDALLQAAYALHPAEIDLSLDNGDGLGNIGIGNDVRGSSRRFLNLILEAYLIISI